MKLLIVWIRIKMTENSVNRYIVTLYSKGTWVIMNSCINECMDYALIS